MNLEEFRKIDKFNAFIEYDSVENLKALGTIPKDFHNEIDDKCLCGSDRIATKDLTIVNCCDPRCYIKMGYTLEDIIRYFGGKNLGPGTCADIIRHANLHGFIQYGSPVEVLMNYDKFEWLLGARYPYLVEVAENMFTRKYLFSDIVQAVSIPYIDSKAHQLFKEIPNSDALIRILENMSIKEFFWRRGFEDPKVAFSFDVYLFDVYLLESALKSLLITPALTTLTVCCTGAIKSIPEGLVKTPTRLEFIQYLNTLTKYKGYNLIDMKPTDGPTTCNYVVTDSSPSGSLSAKHRKALERQAGLMLASQEVIDSEVIQKPYEKILFTTTEFVEFIRNEVDKCKKIIDQLGMT